MEQNLCIYCMNHSAEDICPVCGKSAADYETAPHHLKPGTILNNKYLVGAVLGEGGFGITYIGQDVFLGIRVAIKEYYPSGAVNRNNTCSTEITANRGDAQSFFDKGKDRFLGEARALAKFSNDPTIVTVRDFFETNNTAYIVMEYLEGIDLRDYLKKHGCLSYEQTVQMLIPIMDGLSKIHAAGLIHRDISPANIMVLKDGAVKLLDFGAAREVGGDDDKSLSILLKPGYAPEEQYRTKGKQGPWTDVYALSATMYKMMTGVTPVDAMNRIFCDELEKITALNPKITPSQEAVILKGMAVHQADRFQNIAQLRSACQAGTLESEDDEVTIAGFQPDISRFRKAPMSDQPKSKQKPIAKTPEPAPQKDISADADAEKSGKKPQGIALAGCVFFWILASLLTLNTVSLIIDEEAWLLSLLGAVATFAASFFLGRLYFPRLNNKSRKPRIICLILSIIGACVTITLGFITYVNFSDAMAEYGLGAYCAILTVLSLSFPIFFGYFYYPRLPHQKRKLFLRIYGILGAAALVTFIAFIVLTSLNTVTIGTEVIPRKSEYVRLTYNTITDHEIKKLQSLKVMQTLEIVGCFLDDADVETISQLTQLNRLSLSSNSDITDISALAKLKNLTHLDLSGTGISDISCLSQLENLTSLDLSGTKVSDLSVLGSLSQLEDVYINSLENLKPATIQLPASVTVLHCGHNDLESLAFVTSATELSILKAPHNRISDLTPLQNYQLYELDLADNRITDLSVLDISNLHSLDVSTNQISDISCLQGINAYTLDLAYNQISDLSALTDNYCIGIVNLNNNQITDITPLKDCFRIFKLDISHNQISDISAVATIDDMEIFKARNNQITDISPLASCPKLILKGNHLDLRNNQITDVTPLSAYVNTAHLYLSHNQITDISPLSKCTKLRTLLINSNQVTDLSPLAQLTNLCTLEAVNNPITTAEGLNLTSETSLVNQSFIHISYHEELDFTKLTKSDDVFVMIYDVPEREKRELQGLGYKNFQVSSTLDEEDTNPDLTDAETDEEEDLYG